MASSSLARSDADLTHARASNKRLMAWRVAEMPRTEALRIQLADVRSGREAAARQAQAAVSERLKMAASQKQVAMPTASGSPRLHGASKVQPGQSPRNSPRAGGGSSNGHQRSSADHYPGGFLTHTSGDALDDHQYSEDGGEEARLHEGDEGRHRRALAAAALHGAWESQRAELKAQVEALRGQLEEERASKDALFERVMVAAGDSGDVAASSAKHHVKNSLPKTTSSGESKGGSAGGAAMQLEVLSRRHGDLRRSSERVAEERDALRRALTAVRMAAPELAEALGITSEGVIGGGGKSANDEDIISTAASRLGTTAGAGVVSFSPVATPARSHKPTEGSQHVYSEGGSGAAYRLAGVPSGLEAVVGSRLGGPAPATATSPAVAAATGSPAGGRPASARPRPPSVIPTVPSDFGAPPKGSPGSQQQPLHLEIVNAVRHSREEP